MPRRSILNVSEDIINSLKKDKELSIKSLSDKTATQWKTTLKSLEFLKRIGIVSERKGKKTNKEERLFKLTEKKTIYGKK